MRRLALVTVATSLLLTACGTGPAVAPAPMAQAQVSAMSRTVKAPLKLDRVAVQKGIAAGEAKLLAKGQLAGPTMRDGGGYDPVSFQYGYTLGLIRGSLNTFKRVEGSFSVSEWKSFAYNLHGAMKDARDALQANPALAQKCGIVIGILEGGIRSFASLNGSFDVSQWKSFAYSNRNVLQQALDTLQDVPLGQ